MRLRVVLLLLGSLVYGQLQAATMRCGTQLINIGDRAFEVENKCGPPAQRELLGYTLGGYDRREFKIEEWLYGPQNGMYSILTFEANRLVRIEKQRRR
ncbi:DUF2845 domain-containing protein [Aquipseudomonas campi]